MSVVFIDATSPEKLLEQFIKDVKNKKHIFLFLFLEGCGPCNNTKPNWKKIKDSLSNDIKDEKVIIAEIDQKMFEKLGGNVGKEPMGYPCLRYIHGDKIEEYDDCNIEKKDRSTESFVKWIESKVDKTNNSKSSVGGTNKKNNTRKINTCEESYCDKIAVPKLLDGVKKQINVMKKFSKKQQNKNKITPEMQKQIKKFNTTKNAKFLKETFTNTCKIMYCNKGCKNTIFQNGKSISRTMKNAFKNDKARLMQIEEMRTFLFKGKNSVLKNDFYKMLKPEEIEYLKKNGATSGCSNHIYKK
jgi:hypothetical protein